MTQSLSFEVRHLPALPGLQGHTQAAVGWHLCSLQPLPGSGFWGLLGVSRLFWRPGRTNPFRDVSLDVRMSLKPPDPALVHSEGCSGQWEAWDLPRMDCSGLCRARGMPRCPQGLVSSSWGLPFSSPLGLEPQPDGGPEITPPGPQVRGGVVSEQQSRWL